PSVLLLDEPFSAVDAQTRMVLQRELAQTLKRAGKTALLITHDLLEAVTLSDRVLVMSRRPGHIIDEIRVELPQRDDPIARRQAPRVNEYVARLMDRLDMGHAGQGGVGAAAGRAFPRGGAGERPSAWPCWSSSWRRGNGDRACSEFPFLSSRRYPRCSTNSCACSR